MIIYSKKIIRFIHEIKSIIKEICQKEIGVKVHGERFFDKKSACSYPIHVVVYNNKSMLGYFDSYFYELGFHERLTHVKKEQLWSVIRHELAHYMTFINYGAHGLPHGPEFRAFCQKMGWDESVSRATICLEEEQTPLNTEESAILRRVKKLMALSSSSNENEAELAMMKSRELLLKHNMESVSIDEDDEEKIYLKRILKQKKISAKMRSIATILTTFFVHCIYKRTEEGLYLEIVGSLANVEIAEYVAAVLESELEKLWQQAQKCAQLKGIIAKNSFFLGIAKGYCDKIEALKRAYTQEMSSAIVALEKKLSCARTLVYNRLSSMKCSGSHCKESSALGEQMGRELNINPALNRSSSKIFELTRR